MKYTENVRNILYQVYQQKLTPADAMKLLAELFGSDVKADTKDSKIICD